MPPVCPPSLHHAVWPAWVVASCAIVLYRVASLFYRASGGGGDFAPSPILSGVVQLRDLDDALATASNLCVIWLAAQRLRLHLGNMS